MRKVPFTEEQVAELARNPYTHSVTADQITFTLAFKQLLTEEAGKGIRTRQIFQDAGYNTDWFTVKHLTNIRGKILKEADSRTGLKIPRGLTNEEKARQYAQKDLELQQKDASIRELQKKVSRLELEIEFLKKISHAYMNVEKKHRND